MRVANKDWVECDGAGLSAFNEVTVAWLAQTPLEAFSALRCGGGISKAVLRRDLNGMSFVEDNGQVGYLARGAK